MPDINHVDAQSGDVLLLVGTMKGAFILRSTASRTDWTIGGPYFPGRAIYALITSMSFLKTRTSDATGRYKPRCRTTARSPSWLLLVGLNSNVT